MPDPASAVLHEGAWYRFGMATKRRKKALTGSELNGFDVSIPAWAGLELTEAEEDRLYAETRLIRLVEECLGADLDVRREEDAGPGMNDTYYTVWTYDVEARRRLDQRVLCVSDATRDDATTAA